MQCAKAIEIFAFLSSLSTTCSSTYASILGPDTLESLGTLESLVLMLASISVPAH